MVVTTVNFDPTKGLAPAAKDGPDVADELLSSSQIIPSDKDKEDELDRIVPESRSAKHDALKALEEELEIGAADEKVVRIKVKDIMGVTGSCEAQLFVLQPTTTIGEFFIDVSCRFGIDIGTFDILYQTRDFSCNLAGYVETEPLEAIAIVPCPDKTYSMCLEISKSNKKRKSKDIFNASHDGSSNPDIDIGFAGALELSPLIKRDFVGLKNRNMTCYLNSFLQGLWFTPEFRNVIYNYVHDPGRSNRKSICEPLQKLFLLLQLSIRDSVDTDELIRTFGWADRETWMQHDIEELFSIVMESITKELVDTPFDGIIQALYFGTLYDYLKCLECNYSSERSEDFLVVPLPIRNFGVPLPSPTLEAALNAFVQLEVLDKDNRYKCGQCSKLSDAHKGLKFKKLPYILTFQLKRFEYDYTRDKRFKLNDKIIFPFVLDMNPYIETPSEDRRAALKTDALLPKAMKDGGERKGHTRPSVKPVEEEPNEDKPSGAANPVLEKPSVEMMQEMVKTKGPEIYQLYGVMVHRGGINSGHYFAYIMDFERGKWYRCDDAVVRQASLEDIQSTYGGDREEDKELTSAYMLLYRRFDPTLNLLPYYLSEMPVHMQTMWTEMEQIDKQLHDEEELAKNAIKMSCFAYDEAGFLVERAIQIPKNLTMADAAKYVQEDFRDEIPFKPGVVRLVRFDRDLEIIENSFDGCETELVSYALKKIAPRTKNEAFLMQWKPVGCPFTEVYRPSDIIFQVQQVDCLRQEILSHFKEVHVDPAAVMADLKSKIMAVLYGDPMVTKDMYMVAQYGGRFSFLIGDDRHPLSLYSFDKVNNLHLHIGAGDPEISNKLLEFIENFARAEVMVMYVQLPTGFSVEDLRQNAMQVHTTTTTTTTTGSAAPAVVAGEAQVAPTESQKDANVAANAAVETPKLPNGDATSKPDEGSVVPGNSLVKSASGTKTGAETASAPPVSLAAKATSHYFMKFFSVSRSEQENLAFCELRIDPNTPLYALSQRISQLIPVAEKDFVLYKIDKEESTEMRRMTERITTIKPFDHMYVKLEHRLQDGEARLPVYKLNLGSVSNPLEYLTDIVVTLSMSVDDIKAAILDPSKSDIASLNSSGDVSKVRIRKKIRTNPSKVLRPNTKLQDVFTASSIHCGELYVQLLPEPCTLTEKTYCLIYLRWHPSTGVLDAPKEISVFHDYSTDFEGVLLAKLKESMGADFEVEVAKPDTVGYPWQMSARLIQDLAWFPLVPPVRKSLYVYSDELVLLVRDKNEVAMDFSNQPEPHMEDEMEAYRPKHVLKSLPVPNNNDRRETGLKLNLNKSPTKP